MQNRAWTRLAQWKGRAARAKSRVLVHSPAARHWRERCWPIAGPADGLEVIHSHRYEVFGSNRVDAIQDPRARESFAQNDRKWRLQEDIIYRARGSITIEPSYSLAYLPGRRLIDPIRGVHDEVVPSLLRERLRHRKPARHFDALLHFDGFLGKNLWHFFADAFNPLLLVEQSGLVPADTPILIHKRIWDMPLAQLLFSRPPFSDRQWVVQDDESWITTECLYKAVATQAWFKSSYEFIGQTESKAPRRNIFLDRRPKFGRRVSNMAEIGPVLQRLGFETVFAEDLAYEDQIRLMAGVKSIVAIHGAGLTNLLFADLPSVRCLEILPESYLNPHYYWLLQVVGAERYDAIVGSRLDSDMNFTIDAKAFERQLEALVD